MYDPAVFHHPRMKIAAVQREVEQPNVYLLAMASDTVADKLMYIDERLIDITQLQEPVQVPGKEQLFTATMRSFKGDNPEQQYEAGTNQGGHYKCSGCGMKTEAYTDITASLQSERLSILQRNAIATAGVFGKRKGHAKPLAHLNVANLRRELAVRGIDCSGKQKELSQHLQDELRGTQRVLTLINQSPTDALEDHNLASYEIFSSEGLHDVKDHIKNVCDELPHHIEGSVKEAFTSFVQQEFGTRATVRGSDYRKAAMKLPVIMRTKNAPEEVQGLVDTMAEICLLLYMVEEDRTPKAVLRLYNTSFRHALFCMDVLYPTKHLSNGVMFGLYYHSLLLHAAEETRLVSGYTRLAENEERQFKHLRELATCTNRHPEDVARQLFERLQLKQATSSNNNFVKENNRIEKKANELTFLNNDTEFTDNFIENHQQAMQAHLQRIADYLLPGEGVWWVRDGDRIRFLDGKQQRSTHQQGPQVAHFRDTSLPQQLAYVENCWSKCIEGHVGLPIKELRLQEEGQRARFVAWPPTVNDRAASITRTEPTVAEPRTTKPAVPTMAEPTHDQDAVVEPTTTEPTCEQDAAIEHTHDQHEATETAHDQHRARETVHNQHEVTETAHDQHGVTETAHDQYGATETAHKQIEQTPEINNVHTRSDEPPKKRLCKRLPFTRQTESRGEEDDWLVEKVVDEEYSEEQPQTFLTIHGKWLACALGATLDVIQYDKLRFAVKKKGEKSPEAMQTLKGTSCRLHKVILAERRKTEQELLRQPQKDNALDKRRRVLDKLLSSWQ